MKRGATVGMFDGVHRGHRYVISELKKLSEAEPLVVTFSNHPLTLLHPEAAPRLITTSEEKRRLLEAEGVEVLIVDFDEAMRRMTARDFLRWLKERHEITDFVLGYNNRFGSDRNLTMDDYVAIGLEEGVKVSRLSEYTAAGCERINSSLVREALCKGDVEAASAMLGRPFMLEGVVEEGSKIGRRLGFPTANLSLLDADKIIPAQGVYAVDVELPDGSVHRGVVNIGERPTIADGRGLTVEVHIVDFEQNLYSKVLKLRFLKRLRDERRFETLEALKEQLAIDVADARL